MPVNKITNALVNLVTPVFDIKSWQWTFYQGIFLYIN